MKLTLLHTGSMSPAPIAEALAAEQVETLIVRSPRDLVVSDGATVCMEGLRFHRNSNRC